MPISDTMSRTVSEAQDRNVIAFTYEFLWDKDDFAPRRGMTNDIDRVAREANTAIKDEVKEFILHGRDRVQADSDTPPAHGKITGRVFVFITAELEGSGEVWTLADTAGREAKERVVSLLSTRILNGGEGPLL